MRHDGFIPWDDDLDLGMTRNDYEKFKSIYSKELSDRYILTAPNSQYEAAARFIQLYKIDSYYEAFAHRKSAPKKLYIDIFPIDYVPNNCILRKIKGHYSNLLMFIAGSIEFNQDIAPYIRKLGERSIITLAYLKIRSVLGSIAILKKRSAWYTSIDKAIKQSKKTKMCTSGTGRKHYLGECVPTETFLPLKEDTFMGVKAWIPNDTVAYLCNLYGDNYMEVPPIEKREHHFVKKFRV